MISNWEKIDGSDNRLKLRCNHENCTSSICNVLYGKLHLTSVHGDFRHSYTFTEKDMKYLVTHFILSLDTKEKEEFLSFLGNL